jgi:hypothetical protein
MSLKNVVQALLFLNNDTINKNGLRLKYCISILIIYNNRSKEAVG